MKRIFTFISLFCMAVAVQAQDIHFTQFYHAPLWLNPANAGRYDGDIRLGLNYRTQWTGFTKGYNTFQFYADAPLRFLKMGKNNALAVGLNLANDRSGDAVLNNVKIDVPIAFHLALDAAGKHKISLGIDPNYSMKSVDQSKLNFGNQFNYSTQSFDQSWVSGEVFTDGKFGVFDFNGGLIYAGRPHSKVSYSVGASFNHIISPNESFFSGTNKLPFMMIGHVSGDFALGKLGKIHVLPQFLYMSQAKASQMTPAVLIAYHTQPMAENDIEIFTGVSDRLNDALHFIVGGQWKGLRLGLSYDYNSSDLKAASKGFGAVEASLSWIKMIPTAIPPKSIQPCIRFF